MFWFSLVLHSNLSQLKNNFTQSPLPLHTRPPNTNRNPLITDPHRLNANSQNDWLPNADEYQNQSEAPAFRLMATECHPQLLLLASDS
jgi:hypothetical protein